MDEEFENFNDPDDPWFTELEIRDADLEQELFDWRAAHARELAETGHGRDRAPHRERGDAATAARRARRVPPREDLVAGGLHHIIDQDGDQDDLTTIIRTGARPGRGPATGQQRTQALIDRGRRSVTKARTGRTRKLVLGVAAVIAVVTVASMIILRPGPGWPPSVATVQREITTACQNPNVASEPGQVNFACGKNTSQILWVFALLTSGDNAQFSQAKTGRLGLEPITPTQGGEVAWSLNLHHPYNPYDPVDSLAVAARAINNIIGGATLTSTNGKPAVQPGLESEPANCARYTGSSAVVSHAGFPSMCAQPVASGTGQAALVADTYKQWEVGATQAQAYDVSVLFANASNPGDAQVQAILKTLPAAG